MFRYVLLISVLVWICSAQHLKIETEYPQEAKKILLSTRRTGYEKSLTMNQSDISISGEFNGKYLEK